MLILPAIDLIDGACVRLTHGDYTRQTTYPLDPVVVARSYEARGAQMIHIIDLDGARTASSVNHEVIQRIAQSVSIPLQVGGGVRDLATATTLISLGVQRLILGSIIFHSPSTSKSILEKYGTDRIVSSLDFKDTGMVALNGWTEDTSVSIEDALGQVYELGFRRSIVTDISRDGTLTSPNFDVLEKIKTSSPVTLTIAGGVSSFADVRRLSSLGIDECIVGKALYEGQFDFTDFITLQTLQTL